jgi:hypothetical protein
MLLTPDPKIELHPSLLSWFRAKLESLRARPDTTAYVAGVLTDRELAGLVVCGSIVLAFAEASEFDHRRRLADGVLAAEVAFVGWHQQPELCVDLARQCYASCWRTLRPHWPLYEELADRLPEIILAGRQAIRS